MINLSDKQFPVFQGISFKRYRHIPKLVKVLQAMSNNCSTPTSSPERDVYLGKNKKQVRKIGEKLNKMGGYYLMLWVANQIPKHDQRELECAWHGIGDWKA